MSDFSADANEVFLFSNQSHNKYSNLCVGDKFIFGKYKGKPITWIVLSIVAWLVPPRKKKSLLVMSEFSICNKEFHHNGSVKRWKKCDLRSWLNEEFCDSIFSTEEKAMIHLARHGDKLFLLSDMMANTFFHSDSDRAIGAEWWLQTRSRDLVCFVENDGSIVMTNAVEKAKGIRPAFFLNL